MKKISFALSTVALVAVTRAAAADPSAAPSPTPVPATPTTTTTTTQAQAGAPLAPPAGVTTTTQSTTVSPIQPPPSTTPTSTTTVTSADTTPVPPSEPVSHDTTTLNQSIRPNRPLLFTGGLIFAGAYATTAALTAANTDGGGDKNMYIPVVGPWLHLADSGNHEGTRDTLLVAGSGVLQGVGLGMAIASLFVPEKIPAATIQAGNVKMNLTAASFGRSSAGVGALGEF